MCVFIVIPRGEKKRERGSIPWTGARVQHFLQAFQDKGDHWEGILRYLQKLGDVLNRWQAQVNQDTGYPYESPRLVPCLSGSIIGNPMHACTGFIQFCRQVTPMGMAQATLQLLGQNCLTQP
jgi:hypothetical protein